MAKLTIEAFGFDSGGTRVLLDDVPVGVVQHIAFQASVNGLSPVGTIVLFETATNAKTLEKLRTIPGLTVITTHL